MKILFISAANSVHTVRWVNSLAERGHDVYLISLINHQVESNKVNDKVSIFFLPHSGGKGYYLNAVYLRKLWRQIRPDVINVHYASGYGTLVRVARLPRVILNVWGSDIYEFPSVRKLNELILRKNLAYATHLASTSNVMARQTKKYLKKENSIITITPFGVDTKRFIPKKNDHKIFVFGIVKTLKDIYGIDVIINAFSTFLNTVENKNNVRLEIYGEGECKEELIELAKKKGILEQVHFGGYIENQKLPHILQNMDVFLLGSRQESFGVAAVEAMSCELPIVATSAEGLVEVIDDGKTGFLVPIDDVDAMAYHMKILYDNPKLRRDMGRAGRNKVMEKYDWQRNVEVMEDLYFINVSEKQ